MYQVVATNHKDSPTRQEISVPMTHAEAIAEMLRQRKEGFRTVEIVAAQKDRRALLRTLGSI